MYTWVNRNTMLFDLVHELEILEHVFLCISVYMNSSAKTRGKIVDSSGEQNGIPILIYFFHF